MTLGWIWTLAWLWTAAPGQPPEAMSAACQPLVLEDAQGDDDGPGTYRYPTGPGFSKGQFDLLAVTLTPDGEDVIIEATLRARIEVLQSMRVAQDSVIDAFLPQIDLYVDTDGKVGSGYERTVPGRRIQAAPGSAWEYAVVLTALPARVSDALMRADPEIGRAVTVANPVTVVGRTLRARVPLQAIGGCPQHTWGYTVLVTAVTLSTSLKGLVLGHEDPTKANVMTRDITAGPGSCDRWMESPDGSPCTFGGCAPCEGHPRVLDALIAADADQHKLLSAYSRDLPALLPARIPQPQATDLQATPAAPTCPQAGEYGVVDVRGSLVTVLLPNRLQSTEIAAGWIVDLRDAEHPSLGQAVVLRKTGTILVVERLTDAPAGRPTAVRLTCPIP